MLIFKHDWVVGEYNDLDIIESMAHYRKNGILHYL